MGDAGTGDCLSLDCAPALVDGERPRDKITDGGNDLVYPPRLDGHHHDVARGEAGYLGHFESIMMQ